MVDMYWRPDKRDDGHTIFYEIRMLRFAAKQLAESVWGETQWAYLECFLLHYRNLIEFLGKWKRLRHDDVLVKTIWNTIRLPQPANLAKIHAEGQKLLQKYEGRNDSISRYLQHCTTQRTEAKRWEVGTMYNELNELLCEVENAMGFSSRPEDHPLGISGRLARGNPIIMGPESYSTTTVTHDGPLLDPLVLDAITPKIKPTKS